MENVPTHRRAVTWVLPGLATLVVLAVAWPTAHVELGLGAATALVVALAAAGPVALAGVAPLPAWALSLTGAALVGSVLAPSVDGLPVPTVHVVAALGLLLVVVVVGSRWVAAGAVVLTCAVLLLGLAPAGARVRFALAIAMVLVVAALGRQVLRSRRALVHQQQLGARERERRVVLEERARIARDLHDVVAHSMSLLVVRAQTARYRVPDVSEPAAAELSAIADGIRGTLDEVRGVLGVLRNDDPEADPDADPRAGAGPARGPEHRPQPGLADLDTLLEATAQAGVELSVTRTGDAAGTSGAVAVSLYRILAEALANASRHAGGAAVTVVVDHGVDAVRVEVRNGPGTEITGPGAGLGAPGMRERAAAVGGTLRAEPLPDGGFAVEARLPLGRRLAEAEA